MSADWKKLETDVVARIRALSAIDHAECPDGSPLTDELRAQLWNDVVLPNVRLLAEFCANVRIGEDG